MSRPLTRLSDAELVSLARERHREAFDELVRRHTPRARMTALAVVRDAVEAQDVLQEAFFNAWRKLSTFRSDASFGPWVRQIARNCALMRLRSRRRRPEVPLESQRQDAEGVRTRPVVDPAPLASADLETAELGRAIAEAAERLPPVWREVFELADHHHLSMREIADRLDVTVPNAKTRLHRARCRLRLELAPYLQAELDRAA